MNNKYSITCNCGKEVGGNDRRNVEAKMWHHAIKDHEDMIKSLSINQLEDVMKGWDKKFAKQGK